MGKKLPLILALLGGAAGFAARKWQLASGFEPDTHLPIPGALSATVLAVLCAAVAVLLLVLLRPRKEVLPVEAAFSAARGNALYLTAVVLSGFLLLLSAGFELLNFQAVQTTAQNTNQLSRMAAMLLPPLQILFCGAGLPAAVLWARVLYRGEAAGEKLSLLSLCLLYCLWLITSYLGRASDPVVLDYVYEVFAIVCSLLGLYYVAGYSFHEGKPRRTVFFCLMGALFSLVVLADGLSYAEMARCGFAVLFLSAHAALLLHQPAAGDLPVEDDTGAPQSAETEAE